MNRPAPRTLADAICTCGHYCDDHRMAAINRQNGRITMAECRDTICPCTVYKSEARS